MDGLICDEADVLRMAEAAAVDLTLPRWSRQYRILPLDDVLVVLQDRTRRLGRMRWGWRRGDATSRGAPVFAVRGDEAAGRCVRPFVRGRCVILATGFLARAPALIASGRPRIIAARCGLVAIAALWRTEVAGDDASAGAIVLTSRAHECLQPALARMPALLPFEAIDEWLGTATTHLRLRQLLQPWWRAGAEIAEVRQSALDPTRPGGDAELLDPLAQ